MKTGKDGGLIGSLGDYLGKEAAAVAKELANKPDYSEFKLAEALGEEVNETRNYLYRLHDANLASFIKKKDHKIGWYIYYWTFHAERLPAFLLGKKKARLEALKEKMLAGQRTVSYTCANKCTSVDFDRAFEFSFHCPECGSLLNQENNSKEAKEVNMEAELLEKEIVDLERMKRAEEDRQRERSALSPA